MIEELKSALQAAKLVDNGGRRSASFGNHQNKTHFYNVYNKYFTRVEPTNCLSCIISYCNSIQQLLTQKLEEEKQHGKQTKSKKSN